MADNRTATHTSVATEAADWYARLRASDVSELEAVRFRAWLSGDPARRHEFDAIDTFWGDLSAIEHSPEVKRVREAIAARRRKKQWPGFLAMAATLVVAIGGAWTAWQSWGSSRYVTSVGEQRMVPLADGSVVTLNTATEIRLHYSDSAREIELVRGQANFDVAKDPDRPFIVAAGGGFVRALGTVFDVYKSDDKVTVTLLEGRVTVRPNRAARPDEPASPAGSAAEQSSNMPATAIPSAKQAGPPEIVLAAGQQVSFATAADVAKVSGVVKLASADVHRVSAWRARKLDFSNTPLAEAIAEANRYSREQIVLGAPELAAARISGTFEAGKNEAFVEGLQTYFRLDAERTGDRKLILTRRPQ